MLATNHSASVVNFPGQVAIEFLETGDGLWNGIGRVTVGGVTLRSGTVPMNLSVATPEGVMWMSPRVVRRETRSDGSLRFHFTGRRLATPLMEWMVHTVRNRRNIDALLATPQDDDRTAVQLDLAPARRQLAGREAVGLSYQYHFASPDLRIYKLLDHASWAVGGDMLGNEFWMRNCFVPPITKFDRPGQFYSTEWYLPGITNPNIFQFLPLQTELQGFTFTVHPSGVLVTWATRVAHIRSLFEHPRRPGRSDEMLHIHEHCGDLTNEMSTAPVEVLFVPGQFTRAQLLDLYDAVVELVHATLHDELGMTRERVKPYAVLEEWGPPDMDRYTNVLLPQILDTGVKMLEVANHFENNMNTWGVSNMCCTVDYKVSERVGVERLRTLIRRANDGGARVGMWGNTSISSLTEIFSRRNGPEDRIRFLPKEGSILEAIERAADPFVRNPSGAIEADHYTPVFAVLNLRDPVIYGYWMRRWTQAHDEVGLAGIFLDSSFNLSSDKFHYTAKASPDAGSGATSDQTHLLGHYRPADEPPARILSQYHAHLTLMRDMQRAGYYYCNEDLGVFGLHRHGPGLSVRLDNLPLWTDCLCNFDAAAVEKAGLNVNDVFFQALAWRMMWILNVDHAKNQLTWHYGGRRNELDAPTPWQVALLKTFAQVEKFMYNRSVLEGQRGVWYENDGTQVLWAFEDMDVEFPEVKQLQLLPEGNTARANKLHVQKNSVLVVK